MAAYLVLAFIPIGLKALAEVFHVTKRNQLILFGSFLALFLMQCLRNLDYVGIDMQVYDQLFRETDAMTWKEIFSLRKDEYGFWTLNKLISYITTNRQAVACIYSFLILFPIAITFVHESKMPLLTFGLFLAFQVFNFTFSGIRQSIAISIIFFGFRFVKTPNMKNVVLFYVLVILAATFHISALIGTILYPLYHIPIKKYWLPIILIGMLAVFLLRKPIALIGFKFLGKYGESYGELQNTGAGGMLIFNACVMIMAFLFSKSDHKNLIGLRNIMIFIVLIQIFSTIHTIASRFAFYFIPFIALLIPEVLATQSEQNGRLMFVIKVLVYVGSIALMFFTFFNHDSTSIYPYLPFWQAP